MRASWIEYYGFGWSIFISKKHGQNVSCHYDQYYLIFLPYWVQNVKNFRRGRLEDISNNFFQIFPNPFKTEKIKYHKYHSVSVPFCTNLSRSPAHPQSTSPPPSDYSLLIIRVQVRMLSNCKTLSHTGAGCTEQNAPHIPPIVTWSLVSPGTLLSGTMWLIFKCSSSIIIFIQNWAMK